MILAGGRSRRMGSDKALLKMPNGQTLLERTIQIAQALTPEVMVVTPWPERYAALCVPTVQFIQENPAHRSGPLGGFVQGLQQVHTEWCLVLACDLPQLESGALRDWWDWIQNQPDSAAELGVASLVRCVAPKPPSSNSESSVSHKKWETLCGFYRRDSLASLCWYIDTDSHVGAEQSRLSMQTWLEPLRILEYKALPQDILFNCNTAEDWSKVQR